MVQTQAALEDRIRVPVVMDTVERRFFAVYAPKTSETGFIVYAIEMVDKPVLDEARRITNKTFGFMRDEEGDLLPGVFSRSYYSVFDGRNMLLEYMFWIDNQLRGLLQF